MSAIRRIFGLHNLTKNYLSATLMRYSPTQSFNRAYCTPTPEGKEAEQHLEKILKAKFPTALVVKAMDVSGGCGSMYEIVVTCKSFAGMSTVKQHMKVNKALAAEIKDMHGIRISTFIPDEDNSSR